MIVEIRGYAVPFNQATFIGSRIEKFEAGAFTSMLAKRSKVRVLWADHEDNAPVLDESAYLFQDDWGLGFRASVDTQRHPSVIPSMLSQSGSVNRASVGEFAIERSRNERWGTDALSVVSAASIGHISIVAKAAYQQTAVWPTCCSLRMAPQRISDAAARWSRGYGIHALGKLKEAFGPAQGADIFQKQAGQFFDEMA
jgi:HK97 family phage prohead protease